MIETTQPRKVSRKSRSTARYDLYDEYCHGRIDRREFLSRRPP
jgi:hypothetical protein